MKRKLYINQLEKLLSYKSMIFIPGPRQSGKTTFCKQVTDDFSNSLYFNYDIIENKKKLLSNPYFYEEVNRNDSSLPLIIFDEIHKYSDWKNYLKNVYDRDNENYKFLVSGSGRLDLFKRGGDSLAGRYLLAHFFPLTMGELHYENNLELKDFLKNPLIFSNENKKLSETWQAFKNLTCFPEPFLKGEKDFYKIWSRIYHDQLVREDIRDFSNIKNIDNVEILFSLLPSKVGSPLSIQNLSSAIKVSYDTIKNWIALFNHFYLSFQVSCYSKKIKRSILKEKKLYLYDYGIIDNEGAKFENMVALELKRAVSNWTDTGKGKFGLFFLKNKEKEEVDFLITNDDVPLFMVECKSANDKIPKSLIKFQDQLKIPAILLVDKPGSCRIISNDKNKILIVSAYRWLCMLS